MLYRSTSPVEGYSAVVAATPFRPPTGIAGDPAADREWLRALYRRRPHLFTSWARDAYTRSVTLVGDEWETAVLYDALARVARSLGFDIGEPLILYGGKSRQRRTTGARSAARSSGTPGRADRRP